MKYQPKRLRRLDRVWINHGQPTYFITICTDQRKGVLANEAVHLRLQQFLRNTTSDHDWWVGRYVLMPDHWHALIWPRHPLTISQALHDVKKTSARRLHRQRGTEGPLWQHQFWDRFVRHAREFNGRLEYMHLNPARRGLVAKPEEWRWSSHNNFALDKTTVAGCPIQIDYARLPDDYRG